MREQAQHGNCLEFMVFRVTHNGVGRAACLLFFSLFFFWYIAHEIDTLWRPLQGRAFNSTYAYTHMTYDVFGDG
jgi:hypothetical protein